MNVVVMDAIVTTHSAHAEKATETKAHYEYMRAIGVGLLTTSDINTSTKQSLPDTHAATESETRSGIGNQN